MVFETYLLALLVALGALGALAWALRAQIKRAGRYFLAWMDRDRRAEEETRQQEALRQEAEREVKTYLHEEEQPETQQIGRQE